MRVLWQASRVKGEGMARLASDYSMTMFSSAGGSAAVVRNLKVPFFTRFTKGYAAVDWHVQGGTYSHRDGVARWKFRAWTRCFE